MKFEAMWVESCGPRDYLLVMIHSEESYITFCFNSWREFFKTQPNFENCELSVKATIQS